MKHKIFFIISCIVLLLFLTSCSKPKTNEEILNEFANSLNFGERLTKDLDLKESYSYEGKEIIATWTSSNEKILTNNGKYYLNKRGDFISLEVTFSIEGYGLTWCYDLIADPASEEDIIIDAIKDFSIPDTIYNSQDLESSIDYSGYSIRIKYFMDDNEIASINEVVTTDTVKVVTAAFIFGSSSVNKNFNVTIKAFDIEKLNMFFSTLNNNEELSLGDELKQIVKINNKSYVVTYTSDNEELIKDGVVISAPNTKTKVKVFARLNNGFTYVYEFYVLPYQMNLAFKEVKLPIFVLSSFKLKTNFGHGITATWKSSDTTVITNEGTIVATDNKYHDIVLTLTLNKDGETMTEEYKTIVGKDEHMFIDRTFEGTHENTHIENNKLLLDNKKTEGVYYSKEMDALDFTGCVGSFSALTSTTCTVELLISVYSNNTWSKYFSYGKWGKGLKNAGSDQNDTYFKMVDDEILAKDNNVANKYRLKVILRRTSAEVDSPVVSLIALTLYVKDHQMDVDFDKSARSIKYDVPKLYQGDVPEIGGSICSCTTSTMLLKYKGHKFDTSDAPAGTPASALKYEHGYIAYIVRDYGNNIFGNWSYNAIGISSFGEDVYVKKFSSMEEFMYYLEHVGPMGVSIKGDVVNGVKNYHTNGHLMVCTGFKISETGEITYYINDPNVPSVSVEMKYQDFVNVWRMVAYVIE